MKELDKFLDWYRTINKNKFSNKYSPHKPLTILLALAKAVKSERWIEYNKDRDFLENFIWEFSNFKSAPNCLQPLYRLNNDNKENLIWEIYPKDLSTNSSGDLNIGEAKDNNFKAGFSDEAYKWLSQNKVTTLSVIDTIIDDNFTESLKSDMYSLLGIQGPDEAQTGTENVKESLDISKRDPNFPRKILALYDNQCAFCKLKISFNSRPFNMEAAHIKWKARGGDCNEANGMSLCPTHHATFDRGLWTLDDNYQIVMSDSTLIKVQSDIFFKPFIGQSIEETIMNPDLLPNLENLRWHRESIFKD